MNTKLLLLAISAAAFSSCTTMYRSGQTPDDVYYSPVRTYGETKEEVREERREVQRGNVRYNNNNYNNNYNNEDRAIRRGIYDRRWRSFDNDYRYSPYNYGFNYGYYYNPYYWPYPVFSPVFVAPSNPKNTTPRTGNLGQYNRNYNNANLPSPNTKTGTVKSTRPVRTYNNNNGSAVGNVIRQIFTPDNSNNSSNSNSNNNNSSNNNRSYTPANTNSSSSSSSSGSSSSGSGGVSRPPRSSGN